MDDLKELFTMQHQMRQCLGHFKIYDVEYARVMSLALIDEVMEALRETPWKPWKKEQRWAHSAHAEELIDAWHFLINLSINAGMTSEDIRDMFRKKHIVNMKRQDHGY